MALQFLIILSVFICVNLCPIQSGEMPEMAEGARLEIVCPAKSGTEGSNPSLSARKFILGDTDEHRKYGFKIIICVYLCKSVSNQIL